jgi:hypothetical protein
METKSVLDEMSGAEMVGAMLDHWGGKRTTQIIGWVVLFGLSGFRTGTEMRAYLAARGLSKSAMYRALADLKEFSDALDADRGVKTTGADVARKVARVVMLPDLTYDPSVRWYTAPNKANA